MPIIITLFSIISDVRRYTHLKNRVGAVLAAQPLTPLYLSHSVCPPDIFLLPS
jgi:hypothetical protein